MTGSRASTYLLYDPHNDKLVALTIVERNGITMISYRVHGSLEVTYLVETDTMEIIGGGIVARIDSEWIDRVLDTIEETIHRSVLVTEDACEHPNC